MYYSTIVFQEYWPYIYRKLGPNPPPLEALWFYVIPKNKENLIFQNKDPTRYLHQFSYQMQYTNYCSLFTRHGYVYLRYSYLGACGILKSFGFNKANAFLLFAHAYTICNSTLCTQLCSSKHS